MLDRIQADRAKRSAWMDYWQRLFDLMAPHYADFVEQHAPGQSRINEIYDGTARLEARDMSNTLHGMLLSSTSHWFWGEYEDEQLMEVQAVQDYLEAVRDRMWRAIYAKAARFDQRTRETNLMLTVSGNGALFPSLNATQTQLAFRTYHPSKFTIREGEDGVVNSITLTETLTAQQAAVKFGEDKLGEKTRHNLRGGPKERDKKTDFVQVILPRDERDAERIGQKSMPFASVWVDMESESIIREGGFNEFPVAVPRWETSPGETYARGPAAYAIADARTLNAMGKTLLLGAQLRVDPPKWAAADGVLSPVRTWPGGLTVIDAETAKEIGGPPIGQLDIAGDIPLGREMQEDYRRLVMRAFYRDIFRLPQEGPAMTATEVIERKNEFLRSVGPIFDNLVPDYSGFITDRVFNILDGLGLFPDPPEEVEGMGIVWKHISPVQQVRAQLDAAGLSRTMEILMPLAEAKPHMLDNFDEDAIARDAPEYAGMPQKWIKPQEQVEQQRDARAQQEQAADAVEAGATVAGAVKDIGQSGLLEQEDAANQLPA
jgi:hypothetical protein